MKKKASLLIFLLVSILITNTGFASAATYPVVVEDDINIGDSNRSNSYSAFYVDLTVSDRSSNRVTSPIGISIGLSSSTFESSNKVSEGTSLRDDVKNSHILVEASLVLIDELMRVGYTYAEVVLDRLDLGDQVRQLGIIRLTESLTLQESISGLCHVVVEGLALGAIQSYVESINNFEALSLTDSTLLGLIVEETMSLMDALRASFIGSRLVGSYSMVVSEVITLRDQASVLYIKFGEVFTHIFNLTLGEVLGLKIEPSLIEVTPGAKPDTAGQASDLGMILAVSMLLMLLTLVLTKWSASNRYLRNVLLRLKQSTSVARAKH